MKIAILLSLSFCFVACSPAQSLTPKAVSPVLQFRGAWGILGDDPGQLQKPVAMAVDRMGNTFLADVRKGSTLVHKYDSEGHPLLSFFVDGCQHPSSIAVDWGGSIYLADRHTGTIFIFTPDGEFLEAIRRAAGRAFVDPVSLAVGTSSQLYILESSASRIVKVDWFGHELKAWGKKGSAPGEFDVPSKIALSEDGFVFVADSGNHRVQEFNSDGDFIVQWPLPESISSGRADGDPEYSIAASNKLVVASESGYGRVVFWTINGQPKANVNDLLIRATSLPPLPEDVALTTKGDLLILGSAGAVPRVLRFHVNF